MDKELQNNITSIGKYLYYLTENKKYIIVGFGWCEKCATILYNFKFYSGGDVLKNAIFPFKVDEKAYKAIKKELDSRMGECMGAAYAWDFINSPQNYNFFGLNKEQLTCAVEV